MKFDELLSSRESNYDITPELKARKILEHYLGDDIELQKNDDPYGYDLKVYRYNTLNGSNEKNFVCYIEIEVSEGWIDDYPGYWKDYSFLRRKIDTWNPNIISFDNDIKENGDKTIYIIFNKNNTDAVCQSIEFIKENYFIKRRGISNKRRDSYYTVNKYDLRIINTPPIIYKGLDKCLKFISEYINNS